MSSPSITGSKMDRSFFSTWPPLIHKSEGVLLYQPIIIRKDILSSTYAIGNCVTFTETDFSLIMYALWVTNLKETHSPKPGSKIIHLALTYTLTSEKKSTTQFKQPVSPRKVKWSTRYWMSSAWGRKTSSKTTRACLPVRVAQRLYPRKRFRAATRWGIFLSQPVRHPKRRPLCRPCDFPAAFAKNCLLPSQCLWSK